MSSGYFAGFKFVLKEQYKTDNSIGVLLKQKMS
jgi:hypothetical protein